MTREGIWKDDGRNEEGRGRRREEERARKRQQS